MRTRALFFALSISALTFSILLSIFFRNWVRQEIVFPIAFLLWVGKLLLQSIDQAVYWGILVVIGCLIAFSALWPSSINFSNSVPVRKSTLKSRYSQWYSYLNYIEESQFVGSNLARELVRLTVQILSYQYNLDMDEIYRLIDAEEIALPKDFIAFLRRRDFVYKPTPRPAWLEFVYRFFPRPSSFHPPDRLSPVELEIESVLGHIESLLSPQDHPMEVVLEQPTPQHADS